MVKALTFKGDPKSKKRKRAPSPPTQTDHLATSEQNASAAAASTTDDDTAWTTAETIHDVAGPTMLVLASKSDDGQIWCLASDAQGSVYASAVGNVIDDAPRTSEPHDVRQVWIPLPAGSKTSFKAHHAKYLSCDRFGILSADKEAISELETFGLEACQRGTETVFGLRTCAGSIGLELVGGRTVVRGDIATVEKDTAPESAADTREKTAEEDNTRFIVRIQSKYKQRTQVDKSQRAATKISRSQLQADAGGMRLDDQQVRLLRKAKKTGTYHEAMLDVRAKGSHDKYA